MQAKQQALKAVGIVVLAVAWWGQMAGVNHCRLLMHANWAHLALNCVVSLALPSAFQFALMGLQWNLYDCMANRLLVAVLLLTSLIIPQMAFVAHILPFGIGLAAGYIYRFIKQYNNDMGQ